MIDKHLPDNEIVYKNPLKKTLIVSLPLLLFSSTLILMAATDFFRVSLFDLPTRKLMSLISLIVFPSLVMVLFVLRYLELNKGVSTNYNSSVDCNHDIAIYPSTVKLLMALLMFFFFVVFFGFGASSVIGPYKMDRAWTNNLFVIFVFAAFSLLLLSSFLFFAFFVVKILIRKIPRFVVSDLGVLHNSIFNKPMFIPWNDILEIREKCVYTELWLNVIVKNPQDYINNQFNYFMRKGMQRDLKKHGSVASISAGGLKIQYNELKAIIETRLAHSQREKL